jgi:hypothetical protein
MPAGNNAGVLQNAAWEKLIEEFGVDHLDKIADLQMFFMPEGTHGGAYALTPSGISVYGDIWDGTSVLMHEVGHNFGMDHSGGDEWCIMGAGFSETGPLKCYNGAQSWLMGWYNSRSYDYTIENGIWKGRLIGHVDYSNPNDVTSKVLLKLSSDASSDYFVMFNRIKAGTTESQNLVMVNRGDHDISTESELVAKLGAGQSISLNYFHLWDSLEVTVNEINLNANPAYADVTVQLKCVVNCGTNTAMIGATLDTWTGIGGTSIADLMSGTNNLANTPNKSVHLMDLLEGPTNTGDNYGSRTKGWLRPPVSGDYKFWIASNDNGELWLSSDDNPANKAIACQVSGATWPRDWTATPEQESKPISLVAGRSYYYEVRDFM